MSKLTNGMQWFKSTFGPNILSKPTLAPFSLDLMTAIATQETFEVWGGLFSTLSSDKILELCVGDTIDFPGRSSAFPKNKSELLTDPNGAALFQVARSALEAVGEVHAAYHKVAMANPNKFCHGFGVFQYDIQFARASLDPAFFLQRKWFDFDHCLDHALSELHLGRKKIGLGKKAQLTDLEQVHVAIAYNKGSFIPKKGLKQGFLDKSSGKFYGELVFDYMSKSKQL